MSLDKEIAANGSKLSGNSYWLARAQLFRGGLAFFHLSVLEHFCAKGELAQKLAQFKLFYSSKLPT
jgi:hypothetical protein